MCDGCVLDVCWMCAVVSNSDSLLAHGRVVQSILGSRELVTGENWCTSLAKFNITGPEAWSVVSCGL